MPSPLEAITTATLALALEAASRRHAVLASNIANAQTEGYQPLQVAFESQLEEARQLLRERGSVDAAALSGIRIELAPLLDAQGRTAPLQIDAQMAEMSRNAVQFQALLQGLSRHFGILAAAVGDGRK